MTDRCHHFVVNSNFLQRFLQSLQPFRFKNPTLDSRYSFLLLKPKSKGYFTTFLCSDLEFETIFKIARLQAHP